MDSCMAILCREVDKNTGRIATYLCKKNVNEMNLIIAQLRAKANPELSYYVVKASVNNDDFETIEEVLSFLKQRDLKDRDIMRHGGIVKL